MLQHDRRKCGQLFNMGILAKNHSDLSTSSNCSQLSGGTTGGMALVAVLLVALRPTLLTGGILFARPCSNVIDTKMNSCALSDKC